MDTVKVMESRCEDAGYVDARHWEGQRPTAFAVYQKNDMVENLEVRSVTRRKFGGHGKKFRIQWMQKIVNTEKFL